MEGRGGREGEGGGEGGGVREVERQGEMEGEREGEGGRETNEMRGTDKRKSHYMCMYMNMNQWTPWTTKGPQA